MIGQLRVWGVTTAAIVLLGAPAGLLWSELAPRTRLVVAAGGLELADPTAQGPIAADGCFAVITGLFGMIVGLAGYAAGGRRTDIAVLLGLFAGGLLAAVVAWRVGWIVDVAEFRDLRRTSSAGTRLTAPLELRALGVLIAWPLLAVLTFGLLDALDVAGRAAGRDARPTTPD